MELYFVFISKISQIYTDLRCSLDFKVLTQQAKGAGALWGIDNDFVLLLIDWLVCFWLCFFFLGGGGWDGLCCYNVAVFLKNVLSNFISCIN